ncbi:hypothetical protein R1sor_019647 [Riccia sorocarpa]|uniref:Uncharacterized protein n=1 Tax=Riccia sorocarpa TaxID=122646 RepID=A0ABD3ID41_9MARC
MESFGKQNQDANQIPKASNGGGEEANDGFTVVPGSRRTPLRKQAASSSNRFDALKSLNEKDDENEEQEAVGASSIRYNAHQKSSNPATTKDNSGEPENMEGDPLKLSQLEAEAMDITKEKESWRKQPNPRRLQKLKEELMMGIGQEELRFSIRTSHLRIRDGAEPWELADKFSP